jgi:hypothetical protein
MYARVATFEGDPSRVDDAIEMVRAARFLLFQPAPVSHPRRLAGSARRRTGLETSKSC